MRIKNADARLTERARIAAVPLHAVRAGGAQAEEHALAHQLHELRTPINQITGLAELLMELAQEEGRRDLLDGLGTVRESGIELATLLQDRRLISRDCQEGHEYWALSDAARAPLSRVLGFVDAVLAETGDTRGANYLDDIKLIRSAARDFLRQARESELFIRLGPGAAPSAGGASELSIAPPDSAGGSVLIVDDEALNREILCRRLLRAGYRAVGVRSGAEALQSLRSEPFDAVLLDIVMPQMSGIEVLQRIKSDPALRDVPVIMLSALTEAERAAQCIELGAEDYLPKPVSSILLRARLGACLEKKRLRDEEQAALRNLHAEKERLSVTLRSLADAVVSTDANGAIVDFNDVAGSLGGVSIAEARGRPFREVFRVYHRANGRPAADAAAEALARGAAFDSPLGVAVQDAKGDERAVSIRSAPMHDRDGKPQGTVVVIRDTTEREQMADELLRASKLESLGRLAGGLAHDYNNILTIVMGNLSLLRTRAGLDNESLRLLREAETGAWRARDLTSYLLTFSEGGAPVKEVVLPGPLIQHAADYALRGSNVQARFSIPDDLWSLEADADQIAQAVRHLVLNAMQSMPQGGAVHVQAANVCMPGAEAASLPEGDYLRVSIRDAGSGIAPEHLPRIYDPFFSTKKDARGLGLAATYSIVQRHGGQIAVESTPGLGTTVTFYLPAVRRQEVAPDLFQPALAAPVASSSLPMKRQRVLVMEDEAPIRMLSETILRQLACDPVSVADGEEALAAHARAAESGEPFDVVIMDLTIPGAMGGREAIRRLRAKDAAVRTIVSSGYSNDPVVANYRDHGFDAVLPKPYGVSDLAETLQRLTSESDPARK